jgi:hypothetical protein
VLFSIARNLAIDHLRKQQRASGKAADVPVDEAGLNLPAPDCESPFLAAARSEDAKRIATALGALEPIYREALLLRFQENLSLAEIAQVAGAPNLDRFIEDSSRPLDAASLSRRRCRCPLRTMKEPAFCFIGPSLKESRWRTGAGSTITSDNAPNVAGMQISRRVPSERSIGSRLNSTRRQCFGLRT